MPRWIALVTYALRAMRVVSWWMSVLGFWVCWQLVCNTTNTSPFFVFWVIIDLLNSWSTNNEPFSQDMDLKMPLSSQGLKMSNSKPSCSVSTRHYLWKRYHLQLPDIGLDQISAFSASFSWINSCFTAGKRMWVWSCHATCGRCWTTIFTSIVYDPAIPA